MDNISIYDVYPLNIAKALVGENLVKEVYLLGLEKAIANLPEREQNILLHRFKNKYSYREIGIIMGLSHERIRQLEQYSFRKLLSPNKTYLAVSAATHIKEIAMLKAINKVKMEKAFAQVMSCELQPKEVIYNMKIHELNLSVRPSNCLYSADIKTVGDLANMTENDLMNIRSMGITSKNEIVKKLAELGVTPKEV